MTLSDVIKLVGDVLTDIDVLLQSPELPVSSPEWQQLWALRKHLDDEQRELVTSQIEQNTAEYTAITTNLSAANQQLTATLNDITKIGSTIQTVSTIASLADGLLKLV